MIDKEETIGYKIRYMRSHANLRQKDLAEILGCSQELISSLESNRSKPSYSMLQKLNRFKKKFLPNVGFELI